MLDYNDNAPLFQKSLYDVTLAENEEVGNCFLKVRETFLRAFDFLLRVFEN